MNINKGNKKPLFSIITCTYNSADYLNKNIESVKKQTFKDYEHIFIDGNSTDKTRSIINNYLKKDKSHVKLYESKARGITDAFNKGIKFSTGEWIMFLNSDDHYFSPNVLNTVNNYIKKNNRLSFVFGKSILIDIDDHKKRIIPNYKIFQQLHFWLLILHNYMPHQTIFMKRELFKRYGLFDTKTKLICDYDILLKLSKNNIKAGFIDKIITVYSYRKLSSVKKPTIESEHLYVLGKYIHNKVIKFILEAFYKSELKLQLMLSK